MTENKITGKAKNVYQLIADITEKMSKVGISKDNKNVTQGYKFRGIDDVYNVLGGMLAESGLVIIPRLISEDVVERTTKSGGVLIYTKVRMKYKFVSSHDESEDYAVVSGEAMDSADKSTNKAMSAAYKYMAFQTFAIPTEGDNDADAVTHDIKPQVRGGTTAEDLKENWPLDAQNKVVDELIAKLSIVTEDKIKEAKTYTNKIVKNLKFVGSNDLALELECALEAAEESIKLQKEGN